MAESALEEEIPSHDCEVRRHFVRNYTLHCLEGGLFIGGIAFVAPNTVLPKMIESMGGPTWLIAIVPMLMNLGFVTPTLLTAHLVENLHSVKPALLFTGFFQRVSFLAAGLVLYFHAESHPGWSLVAVALAPLVSGLFGGITMTAWLELVAKTIPENRRSSVWAIRFIISSIIGIGAGKTVSFVLENTPGTEGYAILHFILFAFLMVSYVIFAFVREISSPEDKPPISGVALVENLRTVPHLIRSDRDLRNYLVTRSLMNGMFIMIPFLSIHSLRVLDKPESFLGPLLMAHMVGGIAGNLFAGYLGDSVGGKVVMVASRWVFILIAGWTLVATADWEFLTIFFLFGSGFYANQVGTTTLCIEICPTQRRATYLGIMATLTAPTLILSSIVSTLLWNWREDYSLLALATGITMLFSLMFLQRIEEPRKRSIGHRTL